MARRKDTGQILVWAAVGFLGYKAMKSGVLGSTASAFGGKIDSLIGGVIPGVGGGVIPGVGAGGSTGGTLFGPFSPVYGDMGAMEAANPNIRQQILDWQYQRATNGEYAGDWAAFRRFQTAIGAPDPGPFPPQFFTANASVYSETRR